MQWKTSKKTNINAIYALNASHAQNIESGVEAIAAKIAKDVEEQVVANRTMHDYARVMHIMSCSTIWLQLQRHLDGTHVLS